MTPTNAMKLARLLVLIVPALGASPDSLANPGDAVLVQLSAPSSQPAAEWRAAVDSFLRDKRTGVWEVQWIGDSSSLIFATSLPGASLDDLIAELNRRYPPPRFPGLSDARLEGNTAHIRIVDSEMLTQRMGTTGAQIYLAVVTASITSLPGIESVFLEFEEGDHAVPGKYTRRDFLDLVGDNGGTASN